MAENNLSWEPSVRIDSFKEKWIEWTCPYCGYVRSKGWKGTKLGKKPIQALFCEHCGANMQEAKERL